MAVGILNDQLLKRYNVGPVKPWVQQAADYIGTRHKLTTIGGWRRTDQFEDHPSGHALDFMIRSRAEGDAVAADLIANAKQLGLSYLIWNGRTYNVSRGTWAPYTATDNPHTDHVHATFWNAGTGGALTSLLGLDSPSGDTAPDTCAWNFAVPQAKADVPFLPDVKIGGQSFCVLSKVQVRIIFSLITLGVGVGIGMLGVVVLTAYAFKESGAQDNIMKIASLIPAGKASKAAATASAAKGGT